MFCDHKDFIIGFQSNIIYNRRYAIRNGRNQGNPVKVLTVDKLTEIFNLTEGEKYLLLNANVGQGLFFAGLKHVAIQIIASYKEDQIITTNPEEMLKKRDQNDETPAPIS